MATRTFPPKFIGTNLAPYYYLDDGFTLKSSGMITKTGTGTTNGTTITLNNVNGLLPGMFVTGVNIPPLNNSGEPTVIKLINGNVITLNSNLRLAINNLNVYFHNSQTSIEYVIHVAANSGVESLRTSMGWAEREPNAPISNVHTYLWSSGKYSLDDYILMVSQLGINLMPRLGGVPKWAIDYDYYVNFDGTPFAFQDPESDNALISKGVRVTATGTKGNKKFTVTNMDRAFLIVPGMTIGNITEPTLVATKIAYANTGSNYISTYNSISDLQIGQYIDGPNIPSMAQIKSFTSGNPNRIYMQDVNNSDVYVTNTYLYNQKIKFYTSNSFPTANNQDPKQDPGFIAGTRILKVTKNATNYVFDIDKPLIANLSGTNNMTAGISNFEINNNNKSIKQSSQNNPFVFDTVDDANVFLINLRRKGGTLPKNKYDHFVFMNALLSRYGTNGTVWNNSSVADLTTTTSGTSTPTATEFNQTLTLSSVPAKTVVGMTIQDTSYTNENEAYIAPDTKICSINGNVLILSKPLLKQITNSVSITLKFPKIINWQIWNEINNPAYGQNNWNGDFWYQIGSNTPKYIKNEYLIRGANWPFHPTSVIGVNSKRINLIDKNYSWEESFVEFIGEIKKEVHTIDSKAKIVTGALSGAEIVPSIKKILSVKSKINGKYCSDKFGMNVYPDPTRSGPAQLVSIPVGKSSSDRNSIIYTFKTHLNGYGTPTPNNASFPNLIVSEYGWSTDQVIFGKGVLGATTESGLAGKLNHLFSWSSSSTYLDARKLIKNDYYWNIESIMYYPWSDNETGYATASKDRPNIFAGFLSNNVRGLYKYRNSVMKSGRVIGTAGTNVLTFDTSIPTDWVVGDVIKKRDRGILNTDPAIPGLIVLPDDAKITAISSNRKQITINKTLTAVQNVVLKSKKNNKHTITMSFNKVDVQLFEGSSAKKAEGEIYLFVPTKIQKVTKGTVSNVSFQVSRLSNPTYTTPAQKFQDEVLYYQGR